MTARSTSPLAISVAPWSATPLLDTHCQNYTARAETGDLSVVGRREEVQEVILSFMRKQHAVPLLVGEPGVGRESIVVGLAAYLTSPTAVPDLKRARYRMRGGFLGVGDDNTNACLKPAAEAAIAALTAPR